MNEKYLLSLRFFELPFVKPAISVKIMKREDQRHQRREVETSFVPEKRETEKKMNSAVLKH